MHAYHENFKDEAKVAAMTGAIACIIEIEWNVKADPVTKFRECVEANEEKYVKKHFAYCKAEDVYKQYAPYVNDNGMTSALTDLWNFVRKEKLSQIDGYIEYVKFYHRDEEEPMDPPAIAEADIAAWVKEYVASKR